MPQEFRPGRALERLDARDARVLLLWLLAAIAGAGIAYKYFFEAFPEASVNFKVSRAQALGMARDFLTAQGARLDGYQSTVVFNVEDEPKTYLERELGLEQANRLMSSQVNVWYWDMRFFKPLQKEEFRVRVDPGGRIVGYEHVVEEAAPGARLDRADALARATQFLRDTLRAPLDAYTFLPEEANSAARPNRTDWSFTWERSGFRARDAPYRLQVGLEGDRIGGYEEFLKVPEEWQRSFARLRSSNDLFETGALIPYALLLGAALSVVLAMGRRGQLQWKGALQLGLFILALYFAMQLSQWPLTRADYDTNTSYSSFVAGQAALAFGESFLMTLLVVIAFLPGEPLYRVGQPDRLRLGAAFTWPGLRTKEFFRAGVIGICLAAAHIGYIVVFYIGGRRFGVWAPQDLQYSDTLSTALPWIYPLAIGVYAATSEEFLFRLFSIRFLRRVTGSTFLAVVLPAFAWSFLHSNYPEEPPYIRGIELGLIGIVAGLVMLRWGIVATLVWHYSVDAFLTSLSLIRSADLYSRISGIVVGLSALIPVGIAGIAYLARGGFESSAAVLNSAAPLPEPQAPAVEPAGPSPAHVYTPLGPRALAALAVCGALGVAALWFVKPQEIGDFVRFSADAPQAEARADQVLRRQNVDPSGYRRAATIVYTFDPLVNEFLRRNIGVAAANDVYRDRVPSAFWAVRYFRASQAEEYRVVLLPDGGLHAVHHALAEATAGPNLAKEDAQAQAENFLRDAKGLDLTQWKLVEAESDKRPARTDHTFTWEQIASLTPSPGEEGAHIRVQLQVQGDEVSGYRIFIHIPEDWQRAQQRTTLADTAQGIGIVALVGGLGLFVLIAFLRQLRQAAVTQVPWRQLARGLLIVPLASVATFVSLEPQYLATYSTQQPFGAFVATTAVGLFFAVVLSYSAVLFLFGLAFFFASRAGGNGLATRGGMPAEYFRDAFAVGAGGSLALLGFSRLPGLLARIWVVPQRAFPAAVPRDLDSLLPAAQTWGSGVTYGFIAAGVLLVVLGFAQCHLRRAWMQAALLLGCALVLAPQWGGAGDFLQQRVTLLAWLAVVWWASRNVIRSNLLGYLLVAMLISVSGAAETLLRQPNPFFRENGWAVLAVAAGLACWPLAQWRLQARNGVTAQAAAPTGE